MTDITTAGNTSISARPAPRLVLHVGPGLGNCQGQADAALEPGQYRRETTSMLSDLFRQGMAKTGLDTTAYAPGSQLLIAPEAYRTERQATLEVLREFSKVRGKDGAVLGVVSFSHGLVTTLVNAMVDINLHHELAVVVHYGDEREATAHRMDAEGFLEDWPYGVLDALVDEDTLLELGFDVPHKN